MATPKGRIISISPDKYTIGSPLSLAVNWMTEWDGNVIFTVAILQLVLSDGSTVEDKRWYAGGSKKQYATSFTLGVMPSTPVVVSLNLYQKGVSWVDANILPALFLEAMQPMNISDGPYSHVVDPTTEQIEPDPDIAEWIQKYGPWIAGGTLVLGLGVWYYNSRKRG